MNARIKLSALSILTVSLITACGGGSNSSSDSNTANPTLPTPTPPANTRSVEGTLVVPQQTANRNQNILLRATHQLRDNCTNVPAGYSPLDTVTVEFLDANDNVLETTSTGTCGEFTTSVPVETTSIKASSNAYRDLNADINLFTPGLNGVASTIANTANYEISSIQFTGTTGNSIAYSIIDSETRTAVIGIPNDAFEITINANPIDISDIMLASQAADPASVTLVLDSSGSMNATVFDANSNPLVDQNNEPFTRYRLTAIAAHTYLDNMPISDETNIVVFGSDVNYIDDAEIADLFTLEDSNGVDTNYTFSANGFTSNPADLRFVVDAYNPSSILYSSFNIDPRHPDTPDLNITSFYPFGGLTALYDGIELGLNNNSVLSTSNRKIVIAMSDGSNNSSTNTAQDVINSAIDKSIPVHTIAFGGADAGEMENIALSTNASFSLIEDVDLASIFQTIQTGIIFQYLADYNGTANAADTLTLSLNYNGLNVSRDVVR